MLTIFKGNLPCERFSVAAGGLFSNLLNMEEDVDDGRLLEDHCPVDLD